ncbi:hypothetical protein GWI33_002988 [Rhynchophorus ferrugineus]|uniref:Uncharacterized protein n=1 Tax=Rhynchophorus ferrugineus TaxID=354439 RepID=A0A834IY84_RHYFE|nr:hypothetical protein GWI33_002988 [Rhynchophorus ferrugineus]
MLASHFLDNPPGNIMAVLTFPNRTQFLAFSLKLFTKQYRQPRLHLQGCRCPALGPPDPHPGLQTSTDVHSRRRRDFPEISQETNVPYGLLQQIAPVSEPAPFSGRAAYGRYRLGVNSFETNVSLYVHFFCCHIAPRKDTVPHGERAMNFVLRNTDSVGT